MSAKISKLWNDVIEVEFKNENAASVDYILTTEDKLATFIVKKIINDSKVYAVVIDSSRNLKLNEALVNTNQKFQVAVGESAKNNIFDVKGNSLLNKNDDLKYVEINSTIKNNDNYQVQNEILETGIKAIDFFIPILKGSKIGVFGGAGVGKTVLMKEIIFNLSKNQNKTSSIFIGSGERSREGVELYNDLKFSNLMKNSSMYVSKMNEAAGARMTIVPAGITAAEYLRDTQKENVLLFIDNIFRFLQAGSEVSASLDKKPSLGGYQSTLNTEISAVENRLFSNQNGSITSFQTVFLPMDDLSDPSAVAIFNHLNGSLVLSRDVAAQNIFPAFDALNSSSSSVDPKIIGQQHYEAILETKRVLQKYKELEDVILILGFDELDEESKRVVKIALQLQNFFSQYFFMTEHFTHEKGVFVPREKTIESVSRILNGEFLEIPAEKFAYIQSVDDLNKTKTQQ
ncbi:F0F1 ATP synthase subunit beta [Mycoplasmopsis ciconiae]|uniref:F0F1 ATP synthase subunit beta n=1 Tax=Mycoplasmopsis ciconiae TaxID=561067 RepID=A0ABU7MKX3_9BACT|nr:F0F1 ATP synthase subunit beta [Mycoplasmopsis ciconiae]